MTHEEKHTWLALFASRIGACLDLEAECGFGRECVGLTTDGKFPDLPEDSTVPLPDHAYHKHPCLAVLGRGEEAEAELYDWCRALEAEGFTKIIVEPNPDWKGKDDMIGALFGNHQIVRLARPGGD